MSSVLEIIQILLTLKINPTALKLLEMWPVNTSAGVQKEPPNL